MAPLSPPPPEKPSPLAPKLPKRSNPVARFMSPLPSVSPKSKVKRSAKWRCELKGFGAWSREAEEEVCSFLGCYSRERRCGRGGLADMEDSGWRRRGRRHPDRDKSRLRAPGGRSDAGPSISETRTSGPAKQPADTPPRSGPAINHSAGTRPPDCDGPLMY